MSDILPIEQILVYGNMPSSVFYKTPVWRRVRYQALTLYGNRCQLCGSGATDGPLHVDHIKPRSLYPESCMDIHNLQILCADCHTAKGVAWIDDFHKGAKKSEPMQMRDFFRVEQRHLVLEHRHPRNHIEARYLGDGVRAANKKQRKRWRALVDFCLYDKRAYASATQIRVGEFMLLPWSRSHRYARFTVGKTADDFVFDIAGCLFPTNLKTLLADDQRGGDA